MFTLMIGFLAPTGSTAAQALVRSQVRSDSTRAAIPFAYVEIPELGRTTQANISGVYTFGALPSGRHRLTARAIGYTPLSIEVEVVVNDTLNLDLLLFGRGVRLETLLVTAPSTTVESGKMEEFNARRKMGFGRFFDRAHLASREPAPIAEVLRQVLGVRLMPLPWPCTGSVAVSSRNLGGGSGAGFTCGSVDVARLCFLSVVIDGARVWSLGDPSQPPDLSGIGTADLQAVEVYRGPSETPIEFLSTGNLCGVLILWTRTGEQPQ